MSDDQIDTSPLIALAPTTVSSEIDLEEGRDGQIRPAPITVSSEIDLEEGRDGQIRCRICHETDGGHFIAPCKCKGTSKYVHRKRLDHWRDQIDTSPLISPEGRDGGGHFIAPCKCKGTSKYVHRKRLDHWRDQIDTSPLISPEGRDSGGHFIAPCKCKGTSKYGHRKCPDHWHDQIDTSPLIAPAPITVSSEIDLEEGHDGGGHFIAPCKCKGTSKYVHRKFLDHWHDQIDTSPRIAPAPMTQTSPLIAPTPITVSSKIDLEEGHDGQIQCRICLETDGGHFIAPCKCKGTSKYVHRKCLDHWRAVKEGYAFAHCTTCQVRYHLRVHPIADGRWRALKFLFFVTRDFLFVFFVIQLVIGLLAYLVYLIDDCMKFRLRLTWGFGGELCFYYICGAILFFALLGLSGCFIACFDQRVHSDPAQPCRECYHCCCNPGMCGDYQTPRTVIICSDNTICPESCCNGCCDCECSGEGSESGLALLFIMAVIAICLFAVIGIFYGALVATMVGQGIWQKHYHILTKKMLTEEFVVEDVGDKMDGAEWSPPPLPPEDAQRLERLGLS